MRSQPIQIFLRAFNHRTGRVAGGGSTRGFHVNCCIQSSRFKHQQHNAHCIDRPSCAWPYRALMGWVRNCEPGAWQSRKRRASKAPRCSVALPSIQRGRLHCGLSGSCRGLAPAGSGPRRSRRSPGQMKAGQARRPCLNRPHQSLCRYAIIA